MQIVIEGHCLEWDLSGKELVLKQVVDEVEAFLLTMGKVATALSIDGQDITQEELEERQELPVKGDEHLEFSVINLSDFVIENLDGAYEANGGLIQNINTFADELYSSNKTVDPKEVIENIRDFYFFWLRLHQLLPVVFEGTYFDDMSFTDLVGKMQNIFKEIVAAMEEEDCVLAADLLQYEIVPIIESTGRAVPCLKENVVNYSREQEELALKEEEGNSNSISKEN